MVSCVKDGAIPEGGHVLSPVVIGMPVMVAESLQIHGVLEAGKSTKHIQEVFRYCSVICHISTGDYERIVLLFQEGEEVFVVALYSINCLLPSHMHICEENNLAFI